MACRDSRDSERSLPALILSRHTKKALNHAPCVLPGSSQLVGYTPSHSRSCEVRRAEHVCGKQNAAQTFLSLAMVVVILLSVNSGVKQYKSYRRQNLYEKYYHELSADKSE